MSVRNFTAFAFAMLFLAACSKEQALDAPAATADTPLSKKEINAVVEESIRRTDDVFRWENADLHVLWSAGMRGDSVYALGYQPIGEEKLNERMHLINVKEERWTSVREQLINFIVVETNKAFPGQNYRAEDLLAFKTPEELPMLGIKIFSSHILAVLRDMPQVRYVEPMGYEAEDEIGFRSDSGCGVTPASSIPTADFVTISPSVKVPWNFNLHNIQQAWTLSTGAGISVALIDTGTSQNQTKLQQNGEFNSGQSSGRTITRLGYYVSSWWPWADPDGPNDQCGHGTQMAGLIAAPRGSGGASVGVAYNSNLRAYRATGDVVVNSSAEKNGVSASIINAANTSSVKIMSMSIGDVFWSNQVADAIYYAYGMGKLMFAAAGTSTSWTNWYGVIFPATMAETVAVTGVKEGYPLERCDVCHSGSAVDFIIMMQRRNDSARTSLTLAMSGNTPSRVGGSSTATAMTAGIAALAWARNPAQTRAQVLNRLKSASSIYPSRNSQFGWGLINAQAAVN